MAGYGVTGVCPERNADFGSPTVGLSEVMMMNSKSRPITLTLSDDHLRMMVESHLLKPDEIDDMPKVSRVAQRVFDQALGLPEACWHAWDDWTKGLE